MFTQKKLLFQFTKAIALVILLCFTFSYQAQGEKAVKEKAKDMAEITAQFVEHIEALFDDLEGKFEESEFDEMAELLADYTILATPQGKRLKGKWNLSKFWRKVKAGEEVTVKFTLQRHYVSEVTEPIELPDEQDTIIHVGHAIIEYQLITPEEGGTLTNKTGTLTVSLRHPRMCIWEP